MEFSGEYRLPVGQQSVWEALNNPVLLQASIAGCKQLKKLSETEFSVVVTSKVGPISVTFRGAIELSALDAPNGYTLTGRGQGGAAGFASMTARIKLERVHDEETLLRYTAEAEIGGKLASVGSRLIQGVAVKSADDFFAAFSRQLTGNANPIDNLSQEETHFETGQTPASPSVIYSQSGGGLGAPVPAWLVVFAASLGGALGFCVALLMR
jgi:carbon monoxide dehydrogenase subunit G